MRTITTTTIYRRCSQWKQNREIITIRTFLLLLLTPSLSWGWSGVLRLTNKRRTINSLQKRLLSSLSNKRHSRLVQPQHYGLNSNHYDDEDEITSNSNKFANLLSRITLGEKQVVAVNGAHHHHHHHQQHHSNNDHHHITPPPPPQPDNNSDNSNEILKLQKENERLKQRLRDLEDENEMLHYEVSSRVVLETFEGEGKIRKYLKHQHELEELQQQQQFAEANPSLTWSGEEIMYESSELQKQQQNDSTMQWCDELDENEQCPIEPFVSFGEALRDRAYWLVGLLILQSCSGIILAHNEALLDNHPVIVYFLTMLVGAGGNAGNQASVRVIRGLALGTLNEQTQGQFLMREFKMAGALSALLSLTGFVRAAAFKTPFPETIAVTAALAMIVFSSVCLGAILPIILKKLRVDPAHSSTTIQVVMDILGVLLAVMVSSILLDSPLGMLIVSKLGG